MVSADFIPAQRRTSAGQRHESGDRAAIDGDIQFLAVLDAAQHLAGVVAQLPQRDLRHISSVADELRYGDELSSLTCQPTVRIEGGIVGSRSARHRYCRCGTQLAADNSEHQCARCQRASRDKLIAPPQVPAEFWRSERFRQAFAAQHIGWLARAYRTHPHHYPVYGPSGVTQTLLGQWLGAVKK